MSWYVSDIWDDFEMHCHSCFYYDMPNIIANITFMLLSIIKPHSTTWEIWNVIFNSQNSMSNRIQCNNCSMHPWPIIIIKVILLDKNDYWIFFKVLVVKFIIAYIQWCEVLLLIFCWLVFFLRWISSAG